MSIKHSFISRETLGEMSKEAMKEWALRRKITTKPQTRGMNKEDLLAHIVARPKFVNFEVDLEFEDLIPPGRPQLTLTKADRRAINRQGMPRKKPKKVKKPRKPPQPRGTRAEREAQFDKLFGTGIGQEKLAEMRRRLP